MFNKDYFASLPSWADTLKKSGLPVLIYGTGDGCEKALREFDKHGIKCEAIFTSDDFARKCEFHGISVISLTQAVQKYGQFVIAAAFGSNLEDVMQRIEKLSKAYTLVFPSTSVIGTESFEKSDFLGRFDDAKKVYSLLSDEQSRTVFEAVLSFKITGEIKYLKPVFTDSTEIYENLLCLGENEIYVDAGAYTGDTIFEFLRFTNGKFWRIYALEPNRKNFRKCVKNTLGLDNIFLYNSPAWNTDTYLGFTSGAGRQQQVSAAGTEVFARSIDSILSGKGATYIKYDVEGAEREAILGSARTIEKYSPKICTALYHRAYDMLDIPLLLHSYLPTARLYMRQYPYYPAWETNLFVLP